MGERLGQIGDGLRETVQAELGASAIVVPQGESRNKLQGLRQFSDGRRIEPQPQVGTSAVVVGLAQLGVNLPGGP